MINADKIKYIVWQVVDVLSEKYALGEIIDCTLKLLVFKKLSDQSRTKIGTQLSIPKEVDWSVIEKEQNDLAQKFNEVLTAIEVATGVFSNSGINFWSRFSDEKLRSVIKLISQLDIGDENSDILNELSKISEELIEKRASIETFKKRIYTPQQVSEMMVELMNPQPETSIYDPACGSGELLAEAVKFFKKNGVNSSQVNLYAQDVDVQECAIAKINLILHGSYNSNIKVGNAILKPCFVENNQPRIFDIVLTNPPFNFKYVEDSRNIKFSERFPYGIPGNGVGDYLFIQHILSSIGNKGKASVILPRGVLFREGDEEKIRRMIIEDDLIEAVIEVAPKLFDNVSIPVVIMIFNRSKSQRKQILFIDASREYQTRRGRNFLQREHIDHIVCAYRRLKDENGFAKLVPVEEIIKNKYNLSVDRYIIPDAEKIDVTFEVNKLHRLETKRSELERKIDGYLQALGIEL